MEKILLSFITSFGIVLLAMPSLIKIAFLKRLVDEPGDSRKVHSRRVPTIGGILIFAGTLLSMLLWYPFEKISSIHNILGAATDFKFLCATLIIVFFIGVKDDIIGTAPVKKLAAHLMVAFVLVIMSDIRIHSMQGLFGILELPYWGSLLLTVFTYIVIVNAINLIDGVDGLAGGVGAIITMAYGFWFYLAGGHEYAVISFSLSGSLLAFLVFNFSPARIFMGDSGSLTIGLILSFLAFKMIDYPRTMLPVEISNVSRPLLAMAALSYPLIDTLRVFFIRAIRGVSPFTADRNHIHHKLLDLGLSHSYTVLVIYGFTILMITTAFFLPFYPTYNFAAILVLVAGSSQIPSLLLRFRKPKNETPIRKLTKSA